MMEDPYQLPPNFQVARLTSVAEVFEDPPRRCAEPCGDRLIVAVKCAGHAPGMQIPKGG